ncbi:hypothetical protein BCR44DRAFT_1432501 [Catenaria anguillulae PL171]|uniref:Uncharacterized protein n=1 Tax=Catenaria anguillulae PL171 TaxID=765915 RepID=A0A1Y2HP11_9FUNG|nr:hypothetical protein BCR44DRAFT_1432501 [Catenaria anguillulae PL171]
MSLSTNPPRPRPLPRPLRIWAGSSCFLASCPPTFQLTTSRPVHCWHGSHTSCLACRLFQRIWRPRCLLARQPFRALGWYDQRA